MALAHVLSAMREIILDRPEIPGEPEARLRAYIDRFPGLTRAEAEDLAKIDPSRFETYTHSIFGAERGIIKTYFPISYAILEQYWELEFGEPLFGNDLVRRMHARHPWKSTASLELGGNFCAFVATLPRILEASSALPQIAALELATLELRRRNVRSPELAEIPLSEISTLNVEELLARPLFVSPLTAVHESSRGVFRYFREYHVGGKVLPEIPPAEGPHCAVGSRTRDFGVYWCEVSSPVARWFTGFSSGGETTVQGLAEAVLEGVPEGTAEEQAFRIFLEALSSLVGQDSITVLR